MGKVDSTKILVAAILRTEVGYFIQYRKINKMDQRFNFKAIKLLEESI